MFISVMNENEEVFRGDAEDFLLANDYDEEMVDTFNRLDNCKVGTTTVVYGNFTDEFTVEKIEEEEEF